MSSIADQLEVIRLEHRAIRLERALSALRIRTSDYADTAIPAGLRSAVRDFEREHDAVRQRLAAQRRPADGRVLVAAGQLDATGPDPR